MKKNPILLLGMPRSGTTWLGKIFDSHPDTAYRHEPDSVWPLTSVPLLVECDQAQLYVQEIQQRFHSLSTQLSVKTVGKLPLFPKRYFNALTWTLFRTSVLASKALSPYGVKVPICWRPNPQKSIRPVCKSIESVGRLGVLATLLPEAAIFIMTRHPMGYISSVLRGESKAAFEGGVSSAEDLHAFKLLLNTHIAKTYAFNEHQLQSMSQVQRLALRWMLYNEKALAESERFTNVMPFRYEDLCAKPIQVAKELFSFAQLDWHQQVESFLNASISKTDHAYYSVFKDPAQAAQRWQRELSQAQIDEAWELIQLSPLASRYPKSQWQADD